MATLAEIMALKEQSNPYKGLAQLGNTVADIMRTRKEKQAAETATENQAQAASLLAQASQSPEQGQQLFAQAYNLAPKFVSGFVKSQKEMMGQSDKMGLEREKLDMRQAELDARNLERQLKEETNELKRKELKNKIEIQNQKIEQSQKQAQKEIQSFDRDVSSSIDLVDRMLQSKGLDKAVGIRSSFYTLAGSKAADFEALHDQLTGRQFLNSVQQMTGMGSLSDAEGKKIASAAEALDLSMSPEAYREALERIKDGLSTIKSAGTYNNSQDSNSAASNQNIVEWGSL